MYGDYYIDVTLDIRLPLAFIGNLGWSGLGEGLVTTLTSLTKAANK